LHYFTIKQGCQRVIVIEISWTHADTAREARACDTIEERTVAHHISWRECYEGGKSLQVSALRATQHQKLADTMDKK